MTNPFAEQYSRLSNYELIEIISRKIDYQELAVEAAKQEIESRKISHEDYAKELALIKANKEEKLKKTNDKILDNILKKTVNEINPLQPKKPSAYRRINLISFALSFVFLLNFTNQFALIKSMLSDIKNCDASCIIYLLPFILTPLAIILFWVKQKIGWILLCFLMSFSGMLLLFSLFNSFELIVYELIAEAIIVGILWGISREEIRKIYNVQKNDFVLPMTTGFIVAILNLL